MAKNFDRFERHGNGISSRPCSKHEYADFNGHPVNGKNEDGRLVHYQNGSTKWFSNENFDINHTKHNKNSSDEKNIVEILEIASSGIEKFTSTLQAIDNIGNTILSFKELDRDMKLIDAHVNIFIIKSKKDLSKFKTKAKIVEKQLDKLSNKIDLLLDRALSIDTKTDNINEIELRSKILDNVNNYSMIVGDALMKLIMI